MKTCTQCNAARISGAATPQSGSKPSAWLLAHRAAREASIGRHSGGSAEEVEIGGGVYLTAAQVRALLDRVQLRWIGMRNDFATHAAASVLRPQFEAAFEAWNRFYRDAYDDWIAWGTNVDQAEAFDRELDSWRSRFETETGRTATNPTTSTTSAAPSSWPSVSSVVAPIAVIGGLTLFAWAHTR